MNAPPAIVHTFTPRPDPAPGAGGAPATICGFQPGRIVYMDRYVIIRLIGPKYCDGAVKRRNPTRMET